VLYIRNNYKTREKYGELKNEIKAEKFYWSVVAFFNYKTEDDNDSVNLFYTFKNSTEQVRKYTPFNLKETDIIKIILNENNSLNQSAKISTRRGTSLQVLENNYNINK
jgi:hypothetical protein